MSLKIKNLIFEHYILLGKDFIVFFELIDIEDKLPRLFGEKILLAVDNAEIFGMLKGRSALEVVLEEVQFVFKAVEFLLKPVDFLVFLVVVLFNIGISFG